MAGFRDTFKWLLSNNTDSQFMELFYKAAFNSAWFNNSQRCKGLDKIRHARGIAYVFAPYISRMQFTHFSEPTKKEFLCMLRHPVWYGLRRLIYRKESNPTRTVRKFLGIKLSEREKTAQCDKRKLLYLPVRKEIFDRQGSKIFYLGLPLIQTTKKGNVVEKRFLGIHYKTKRVSAKPIPFANDVRLLQIITHANAITNTHRETFTKYKNCHSGQSVALIATGSTLNFYEPKKDWIHVGVNKAVAYNRVHFDYLFFHDFVNSQAKEILKLMGRNKSAKKFYGIAQDIIRQDWIIPESAALRDGAERYYLISQWKYPPIHLTYDIANEPLSCPGSVSFAAMQFILWTNPRRIYLVGQDITSKYFDGSPCGPSSAVIRALLLGWRETVKFAKIYYPDTEIVSINPVGLKGMFKDKYTRAYLKEHPEIEVREDDIIDED